MRPSSQGVSRPLREIAPAPPGTGQRREPHAPLPVHRNPRATAPVFDPVAQTSISPGIPGSVLNFEGIGNLNGVLPPDTNGDIGRNHYVQWVNLSFAVFNRSGSLAYGPFNGNQLWNTQTASPCYQTNDGDPIVLYDELADRWLLSQFALPNFPFGPYYQCIAVSTGSNPAGSYYLYEYQFTKLNDYPKFGVWHDAYYFAVNQFQFQGSSFVWGGQGVAAFDRAAMLNGAAQPPMVYFDRFLQDPNLGGMLPADVDGAAPPAGAPGLFAQVDDNVWGYSPDQIQIWALDVDWANLSLSTFTKQAEISTAPFDSNLCGYSRNCIPQPRTGAGLDALSDRLMYRLQYRNFGDSDQRLVVSHSVDVDGNDRAGVRWYEIRDVSGTPTIFQQSTYAPGDGENRWMGTAAMDAQGNIALGYNVSSKSTSPSIRFTTRCAADALGTMPGGEGDLRIGAGQQRHNSSRWGDYSMLALDPVDGLTFWFTGEYTDGRSLAGWKTYVGSFTVTCGPTDTTLPTAPTNLTASNGTSSSQIDLEWVHDGNDLDGFMEDLDGFTIKRCVGDCTADGTFSDEHDTVGAAARAYSDTGLSALRTFTYQVFASDAAGNDSSVSNSAVGTTSEATTETPDAPVLSLSPRPRFIRLSWSNVAGETGYNLHRNDFAAPLAFGPDVTTYNDRDVVAGVEYTYYVEACNGPGNCAAADPVSGSTR